MKFHHWIGSLLLAATAGQTLAEANKVCFYEHYDYQGAEWCYSSDSGWIGSDRNDRISSIKLYGDAKVTIYQHGNYGGAKTTVMANTYKMDDLNDNISSFRIGARQSNDFACLFEHPGFRGTPACAEAGEGISDMNNVAMGRNKASSLVMVGKARVEIFEYPNYDYSRQVMNLSRSTSNLEKRPANWTEDNIDSFRVFSRSATNAEAAIDINEAIGYHAPINQVDTLASHNAFNSTAYFSGQLIPGPNHRRALIEQLQIGARFFELDVSKGNGYAKVCHSIDCGTFDVSLRRLLAETETWLKGADDNDVVFFFIQDDLDGDNGGYQQLQNDVAWLGDIVYTPGACQSLPDDMSFAQMRAQGKRMFFYKSGGSNGCNIASSVLINSETNIGVASINIHDNHFRSGTVVRSQECDNHFCNDVISGSEALIGLTNGVNAFGLDMLEENDIDNNGGRFHEQLWAAGPEQVYNAYANGRTATFKASGDRYVAVSWNTSRNYACRLSNGNWAITDALGDIWNGSNACATEYPGSTFDVPVSAYEARLLRDAIVTGADVHINFGVNNGQWVAGRWGNLTDR
ncbi:Uncharacterised protein [BD1-7 clade bacterium]|uniref:Beta/gamma crystallin 'Greek key' domain-containing protein n=1 Tax=BD1-7 clade bacterium TaxID=2029982 RepID=A0A5S9MXM9_9GAMM|nr:Uncharacterised protein [BD1-7 clade bacterium]CAA0083472.1 Uncharacterised protein [BD1-7 clade bacterium]